MPTEREIDHLRDSIGELYSITRNQGNEITRLVERMENARDEIQETNGKMQEIGMQFEQVTGEIQHIRSDHQAGITAITTEQKAVCKLVEGMDEKLDNLKPPKSEDSGWLQKAVKNPWVWAALIYVLTQGYDIAFDPTSGAVSITQPVPAQVEHDSHSD